MYLIAAFFLWNLVKGYGFIDQRRPRYGESAE
jgi:hypothetical protein